MLTRPRARLTYANVVSTICLFVVLGGTSYAAINLPKNAVKERNIAPNAVTSPKVKDGSLLAQDFAPGQLPQGPRGDQGPQGGQGAKGDPGSPGAPGTARAYAYVRADGTLDPSRSKNVDGVTRAIACADWPVGRCGPGAEGPITASPGIYCFKLSFSPQSVVATADNQPGYQSSTYYRDGAQASMVTTTLGLGGDAGLRCPTGYGPAAIVRNLQVQPSQWDQTAQRYTYFSNGNRIDAPFFIVFN